MNKINEYLQKFKSTEIMRKYTKEHRDEFVLIEGDNLFKLQKCLIYMLKDIDTFFEKQGITYCISGGTLLGKIRHNGFIPWDDDLDIVMPRKDYDRLKKIFENSDDEFCKKYDFRGPGYCKGAIYRISKIYKNDSVMESIISKDNEINKVFIDIFPIDYVPDNNIMMYIRGIMTMALIGIIACVEVKENGPNNTVIDFGLPWKLRSAILKIFGNLFSFYSLNHWYNLLDSVSKNTKQNVKSKRITFPTGSLFYFSEMVPAEVYYPFKRTEFCGITTWIPNQPEKYLENRYGNWQKIPDPKDRENHFVKKLDIGDID